MGLLNGIACTLSETGQWIDRDVGRFDGARRVLDVGCGSGAFLGRLGSRGVGIDGSEEAGIRCRARGLDVVPLILPGRFPFDDGVFDGVCCSHLVEHFPPTDAAHLLSEIDRVLAPGGTLLIRSPLASPQFFDDPTHVRPYHLHAVLHFLGGWESPGARQMIVGDESPRYLIRGYYEERGPVYVSTIAPTIDRRRFAHRLVLRGVAHLLLKAGIGRKVGYGAFLVKNAGPAVRGGKEPADV
jgi:SAM-dependent methyltransferase